MVLKTDFKHCRIVLSFSPFFLAHLFFFCNTSSLLSFIPPTPFPQDKVSSRSDNWLTSMSFLLFLLLSFPVSTCVLIASIRPFSIKSSVQSERTSCVSCQRLWPFALRQNYGIDSWLTLVHSIHSH